MKPLVKPNAKTLIRQNKGQILLEYILLLTIGVTVATLLTSRLVSRSPDSPGVIISKWSQLIQLVGEDIGD